MWAAPHVLPPPMEPMPELARAPPAGALPATAPVAPHPGGGPAFAAPFQVLHEGAPTLASGMDPSTGRFRLSWMVPARKLTSKDRSAISADFRLHFVRAEARFRLRIHPTQTSHGPGGQNFLSADGRGRVELKCETDLANVSEAPVIYRISVRGVGEGAPELPLRGPVAHDFARSAVSAGDAWDFKAVTDGGRNDFVVCLEELPRAAP